MKDKEEKKQLHMFASEENKKIKSCAFSGHRTLSEDFSQKTLEEKTEELINRGAEVFYNGMAVGFDLCAAKTVLALKEKYPYIKLVACVPFYGQDKNFSPSEKELYAEIIKKADEQIILSERYFKGCLHTRNRYMADRADVMIAYCKKQEGGTAYTVKYFQKKYPEKEIIFL